MRVLVTGGTGLVGEGAVTALAARKHSVRLLARTAKHAARGWPAGVEPYPGDVTSDQDVAGAAADCDAVLHIAGIEEEDPPQATFQNVNVEGTRRVLEEAARAGVTRFVFVSSLGADRGSSAYHLSKLAAERSVREFPGDWVIVRSGNVYGPGDQVISLLLKMVRGLPAVPVIGDGEQPFQPVWHEDLAEGLARAVERDDLYGRVLEVAGAEVTSMNDVLRRLSALTGRQPMRIPVPDALATLAVRAAASLGLRPPVNADQLTMLREVSVIRPGVENALTDTLGLTPTPLAEGLRRLVQTLPEQLPQQGVGTLERKRYWADIEDADCDGPELRDRVRARFAEVMPLPVGGAAASGRPLRKGATFTLDLPARGQIQMRLAESLPDRLTFLTLEGHPLAGALSFVFRPGPCFEVETHTRAANALDQAAMAVGGGVLQDENWVQVVERVCALAGGRTRGEVGREAVTLEAEDARRVEEWLSGLVVLRKREQRPKTDKTSGGRRARRVQPRTAVR